MSQDKRDEMDSFSIRGARRDGWEALVGEKRRGDEGLEGGSNFCGEEAVDDEAVASIGGVDRACMTEDEGQRRRAEEVQDAEGIPSRGEVKDVSKVGEVVGIEDRFVGGASGGGIPLEPCALGS